MPILDATSWKLTSTDPVFAITSMAPREKPKTPLIAGSVCGGVMGIAWIIGFLVYFRKRYRRKKLNRQIAAGKAAPKKPQGVPEQKIIVPPDPAVLFGHHTPGERLFKDRADTEAKSAYMPKRESQQSERQHLRISRAETVASMDSSSPPTTAPRISDEMNIPP